MDSTHAETVIRFLSWRFGVRIPRLNFTRGKGHYGNYSQTHQSINIGKMPAQSSLAHEFAHHLDAQLNGKPKRWYTRSQTYFWREKGRYLELPEAHSESFYFNLRRVIVAIGIKDYPWLNEYRQIARWARRDGLVSAE